MLQKLKNLIFRIITKFFREFYLFFKLRPDSYPYISGDGFRNIADFVYDETNQNIDVQKIKENDVVFVQSDLIDDYFKNIHPLIKEKYKLITHNGDKNIGEKESKYMDGKIIKWFAQNVETEHPKLISIPIGLENKRYFYNGIPFLFNKVKKIKTIKKDRVLFGFSIKTNPQERQSAFDELIKCKVAEQINGFPKPYDYLKKVNQYKFVASPLGNGVDCHRTWEAMYVGAIPIIKRSIMGDYFKKIKLPVLIIDSWKELNELTENDLRNKYGAMMGTIKADILFMNYWINKIKND